MKPVNIYEFLQDYTAESLLERGVLRGNTSRMLRARSVSPLLELMKEIGIDRLEYPENRWFLETNGAFQNPHSAEITEGLVTDLEQPGNLFNHQNRDINPHYRRTFSTEELPKLIAEAEKLTFHLEAQLQAFIREHLEDLEPGLSAIDGGKERTVETGRIEITAQSQCGDLVVIELKAGEAKEGALTQLLGYMAALSKEESKPVRGILVAGAFPERLAYAASIVDNVALRTYEFQFQFSSVETRRTRGSTRWPRRCAPWFPQCFALRLRVTHKPLDYLGFRDLQQHPEQRVVYVVQFVKTYPMGGFKAIVFGGKIKYIGSGRCCWLSSVD